jgi:hypothetical protein
VCPEQQPSLKSTTLVLAYSNAQAAQEVND